MSKVCDGLRGDAFVAAQEVGFDYLCEIVDGIPRGIDTLIQHMRGMVFPLTEHESKELFRQHCRPGGHLSRQNGECMKQYVSRRRRSLFLGSEIHLSEGLLLDLSGLTHEERVMVQASISNARDFDRVAEALIIQHPRIHLGECQRRAKGKGKDGFKRVDNPNTRCFREKKAKTSRLAAENLERVLIMRTSLPLQITIIIVAKTWMNPQTPTKPTTTQSVLEAMTEISERTKEKEKVKTKERARADAPVRPSYRWRTVDDA